MNTSPPWQHTPSLHAVTTGAYAPVESEQKNTQKPYISHSAVLKENKPLPQFTVTTSTQVPSLSTFPMSATGPTPTEPLPAAPESDINAIKRTLFHKILTEIVTYSGLHPNHLTIFGSAVTDLLEGRVNEDVNDLDLLVTDATTANAFLNALNLRLQRSVYDPSFPVADCVPNIRYVNTSPNPLTSAPPAGQLTLFLKGVPWIKIECTVKQSWMTGLDFTQPQQVNKIPVFIEHQRYGTLPVLSHHGYIILDRAALSTISHGIGQQKGDDKITQWLLYNATGLAKIKRHLNTLYRPFLQHPELVELKTLFSTTTSKLREHYSAEQLYRSFFAQPYRLKESASEVKRAFANALLDRQSLPPTAFSYDDLTVMLKHDFDLERTAPDGNCFYQAIASTLNQNQAAKTQFIKSYNSVCIHLAAPESHITQQMVRDVLHSWIETARYWSQQDRQLTLELQSLVLPEAGQTISDVLNRNIISQSASHPNDTAHYGWSSLLSILAMVTGATIVVLRVNQRHQHIEKNRYTIAQVNELYPNLLTMIKGKAGLFPDHNADEAQLQNLLFMAYSGGDHYYAAHPTQRLKNHLTPYVRAEQLLLQQGLFQTVDDASSPPLAEATQPTHNSQPLIIEPSAGRVSPCQEKNTPPADAVPADNLPPQNAASEPPPTVIKTNDTDEHTLTTLAHQLIKKHDVTARIIRQSADLLTNERMSKLGTSLFNEVLKLLQAMPPNQQPRSDQKTVILRKQFSEPIQRSLRLCQQLGHTESNLLLAFETILDKLTQDNNTPPSLWMAEVLTRLQTLHHSGHPQAMTLLMILAASAGSAEALHLAMQPLGQTHETYHQFHFILPSDFPNPELCDQAISAATNVQKLLQSKQPLTDSSNGLSRAFPMNGALYHALTPAQLIGAVDDLAEVNDDDILQALRHCTYHGHILLHRGHTEDALARFLHAAIAYHAAIQKQLPLNHHDAAAGLSAVYCTTRLPRQITSEAKLQHPYLNRWWPYMALIRQSIERTNLDSMLYSIKGQWADTGPIPRLWFAFACAKIKATQGCSLPAAYEDFEFTQACDLSFLTNTIPPDRPVLHTPYTPQQRKPVAIKTLQCRPDSARQLMTVNANKYDPELVRQYTIVKKNLSAKQRIKQQQSAIRRLANKVDLLSSATQSLRDDADPAIPRNPGDIYARALPLLDRIHELTTQDVAILLSQADEKLTKVRENNAFLKDVLGQKTSLMLNGLSIFYVISHIRTEITFTTELIDKLVRFHDTLLTRQLINTACHKKYNVPQSITQLITLLDPARYEQCSEARVHHLLRIFFSCQQLVPESLKRPNPNFIAALIQGWLRHSHDEHRLVALLELVIAFKFSNDQYQTTFLPVIETILLKIQYLTAKEKNGDIEDQLNLYKRVSEAILKFPTTAVIGFYQAIWMPQHKRLELLTEHAQAEANSEVDHYWRILVEEEETRQKAERQKIEQIMNRQHDALQSRRRQAVEHSAPESETASLSSDNALTTSDQSITEKQTADHTNEQSEARHHTHTPPVQHQRQMPDPDEQAINSLATACALTNANQTDQATAILESLRGMALNDSLLMLQINMLYVQVRIKNFFSNIGHGMSESRALLKQTSQQQTIMAEDLKRQETIIDDGQIVYIRLKKYQICNISQNIDRLKTALLEHEGQLIQALALCKTVITMVEKQHTTIDSTAIRSQLATSLQIITEQHDRLSEFLTNVTNAGNAMIGLLDSRKQILALIRCISDNYAPQRAKKTPTEIANSPIHAIRTQTNDTVRRLMAFSDNHLLSPQLLKVARQYSRQQITP